MEKEDINDGDQSTKQLIINLLSGFINIVIKFENLKLRTSASNKFGDYKNRIYGISTIYSKLRIKFGPKLLKIFTAST